MSHCSRSLTDFLKYSNDCSTYGDLFSDVWFLEFNRRMLLYHGHYLKLCKFDDVFHRNNLLRFERLYSSEDMSTFWVPCVSFCKS